MKSLVFAFLMFLVPLAHAQTAENRYWRDKAACLDPDAYDYSQGAGISVTVPQGATWYGMNLMFMKQGTSMYYQRSLDVDLAIMMPQGSTWTTTTAFAGFMYICKPEKVYSDPRYADSKDLYYSRLDRLRTLPLRRITVHIPAGMTMQYQPSTPFPNDFEKGLVTHVSSEDVAWVALNNPNGPAVNTFWELNNEHRIRVAEKLMVPFKRSVFTEVKAAGSTTAGTLADPTLSGDGVVHYVALPADW